MILLLRHLSRTKLSLFCSVLMDDVVFVQLSVGVYRVSSFWSRQTANGTFDMSVALTESTIDTPAIFFRYWVLFQTITTRIETNPSFHLRTVLPLSLHVHTNVDSRRHFNSPLLPRSMLPLCPWPFSFSTPTTPSRTLKPHGNVQRRQSRFAPASVNPISTTNIPQRSHTVAHCESGFAQIVDHKSIGLCSSRYKTSIQKLQNSSKSHHHLLST